MFQEKSAKRSPMQIIGIAVIFILAVLIILTFVIFGIFRDANSAPKIFGYRVYVVTNDRMETRIPKGSAVFVEEGVLPEQGSSSVILCNIENELYVIGFVGTDVSETGDVRYIVKYDNATDDRTWGISESDIVGVAKTYDPFLGWVIRFASSKAGMMAIVIIPCLLIIIYEVAMLLLSRREGSGSSKRRSSSEPKVTKVRPVIEAAETSVRKAEPNIPEIPEEREDIQAPVDIAKEERFVERQLRKANDKLNNTVLESTGVIESEEISLDPIMVDPEPARKLDATSEILRSAETQPKPNPEKPAQTASDALGDLSASRIDELIKLLEEEKKRLSDK